MTIRSYPEQYITWAKEVINQCKPIADDYHLDYYTFQKPLMVESKVLVIALNPGGNVVIPTQPYSDPLDTELTPEKLLAGNRSWNGHKTNMRIFKKLGKMKFFDDLNLTYNWMNYVYFPSKKFNDLKNIKNVDVIGVCQQLSKQLIEILKPELIIFIGTSEGFDKFDTNAKTLLQDEKKRLLLQGKISGITTYGIPHLTGNNITDAIIASIDYHLRKAIYGDQSVPQKMQITEIRRNEIDANLQSLSPDISNNKYTDILLDGIDEDKILIRIDYHQRSVGIRNQDRTKYIDLKHHNFYKKFFTKIINEMSSSWAFQSRFPLHFFSENKEISDEVLALANGIKNFSK